MPVVGTPDLVHLGSAVRAFLSRLDEVVAAQAVLVVVMLAGDALRYSRPPVTLRLDLLAQGSGLRLAVEDQGPARSDPRPRGYRAALLERIATRHGLVHSDEGTTIIWAEIVDAPPHAHPVPMPRRPQAT